MILVSGATGDLGRRIVKKLVAEGKQVRALVRADSPGKADLKALGAEIFEGDLTDIESLRGATKGVEAVITTATAIMQRKSSTTRDNSIDAVDRQGHLSLVQAAKENGVDHFVFTSVPPGMSSSPLIDAKRAVEVAVRASGMKWTVLQPSNFMDIWFSKLVEFYPVKGKAMIYGKGDAGIGWVTTDDVASYAVQSLTNEGAINKDLQISGEVLTHMEAKHVFEEVTGKHINDTHLPIPVVSFFSAVLGLFNPIKSSLFRMGADAGTGISRVDSTDALKLFPIKPTTVREFVEEKNRKGELTLLENATPAQILPSPSRG